MLTEPFRINEVLLRINDLPPGRDTRGPARPDLSARLGICRLPGRSGDLAGDMALIVAWSPDIVISMTEMTEMQEKGAAQLITLLTTAGIAHARFPIRDFGAPENTDARWPVISCRLHSILNRGGRVLMHCLGGKGRSGMIALRLMTERGIPAREALAILRDSRPGAVETDAQEAWGAAGAAKDTLNAAPTA
jgi:hypothetical protein